MANLQNYPLDSLETAAKLFSSASYELTVLAALLKRNSNSESLFNVSRSIRELRTGFIKFQKDFDLQAMTRKYNWTQFSSTCGELSVEIYDNDKAFIGYVRGTKPIKLQLETRPDTKQTRT